MGCCLEKDSKKDAAVVVPREHPLMKRDRRQYIHELYKKQFGIDQQFLFNTVKTMLTMKKKAAQAKEKVLERQNSAGGSQEGGNRPSSPLLHRPTLRRYHEDNQNHVQRKNREDLISGGIKLLHQRFQHIGLQQETMKDDGNCQFRSIAHQLTGSEQFHQSVRIQVVDYMRKYRADYIDFLFESEMEGDEFLQGMQQTGTWGDELTIRAAADLFQLRIHVITSNESNYYICYEPEAAKSNNTATTTAGKQKTKEEEEEAIMDIFLAYISPIHYNSVLWDGETLHRAESLHSTDFGTPLKKGDPPPPESQL